MTFPPKLIQKPLSVSWPGYSLTTSNRALYFSFIANHLLQLTPFSPNTLGQLNLSLLLLASHQVIFWNVLPIESYINKLWLFLAVFGLCKSIALSEAELSPGTSTSTCQLIQMPPFLVFKVPITHKQQDTTFSKL